jgi:hypothetical protein
MMKFIRPRLRMPVRIAALGAVAAAVFAAGPGPRALGIAFAVITGGLALAYAIAAYVRAGEDSDLGAIYGSRADERQKLISLQARGLAGAVAMAAAFGGFVITYAVHGAAWPFEFLFAVTAASYGYGLTIYGADKPVPADDTGAEHQEPPVPIKPGP